MLFIPGKAKLIKLEGSTPAIIAVSHAGQAGRTGSSLGGDYVGVTSVGMSQDVAAQYMLSLKGKMYVYVFGDRPGRIEISGVAFTNICGDDTGKGSFSKVLKFYEDNSLARTGTPMHVTICGSTTISGFLQGMRSTFQKPEAGLIGFMLTATTIPEMWSVADV